jgi:hypothetical protein
MQAFYTIHDSRLEAFQNGSLSPIFGNRKTNVLPLLLFSGDLDWLKVVKGASKMNPKKLLFKFAVLALGLAALHMEANPAKAAPVFCQLKFCSTATAGGHCGTVGPDCNVCHGSDGSTGPCGIQ